MSSPYNQYSTYSQDYHHQQYSNYNQPSYYPSEGFAQSYQQPDYHHQHQHQQQQQPYYHARQDHYSYANPHQGDTAASASYYATQPNPAQAAPGAEADRGLLGALGGGAAGAWGGHKAGHGVLGALGGAILGSLTEDYAKKHGKHNSKPPKHHHKTSYGRSTNSSNSLPASSGLGGMASSCFNQKR